MKAANDMSQSTVSVSPGLPDRATLESAEQFIATLVPPTPQYVWPQVAAAFGTEVWVKHENHTPIGAFKARSATMRKTRCAGCRTTEGRLINTSLEAYRSPLRTRKQPSCVAGGTAAKGHIQTDMSLCECSGQLMPPAEAVKPKPKTFFSGASPDAAAGPGGHDGPAPPPLAASAHVTEA